MAFDTSIKETPIHEIVINPDRQRRNLGDISDIKESISTSGLMNPIIITRQNVLVAGERRLTACTQLGYDTITTRYIETLDEIELHLIELEENVKRLDLSWQDKVRATQKYHELCSERNGSWTNEQTAEALGVSSKLISEDIMVAKAINNDPELEALPNKSTALNRERRRISRSSVKAQSDVADMVTKSIAPPTNADDGDATTPAPVPTPRKRPVTIHNAKFQEWAAAYNGPKFNFLHCDFPYGVNAGDKIGQSSAGSAGGYSDKPEDYFALLDYFLLTFAHNHLEEQAHCMFWFSMDFYTETVQAFSEAGWVVNPFPLVWHKSDNKGIIPDSNRGGRRTYETALHCTLGDRMIVKPVANSFAAATTKDFHMSEKPHSMLEHFFRMFVDKSTVMLDPTCGGGMALKVGEEQGAKLIHGVEMDKEYAARATENLVL